MNTINPTSSSFSKAAHEISSGGVPVDWVTGPVNAVLLDNGVMDVFLPKSNSPLTIDTRSGLVATNGTTIPTQWSNSRAETETFIRLARGTHARGEPLTSDILDGRHNGGTNLFTFGKNAVLISELKDKTIGVAVLNQDDGIRAVEVHAPQNEITAAPKPFRHDLAYEA